MESYFESKRSIRTLAIVITAGIIILAGCGKTEREEHLIRESNPVIEAGAIRAFSFSNREETVFSILYQPQSYKNDFDYWDISIPYQSQVSINTEKMYELYDQLAALSYGGATEKIAVADFVPEYEFSIAYASDKTADDADSKATVLVGQQNEQGDYYAALDGYEEQFFLLPKETVQQLIELKPYDYILKVVALLPIDTVSRITVQAGGNTRIMEKDKDTYIIDGKTVERDTYTSLYAALLSPYITGEIAADNGIGTEPTGQEILSLTYERVQKEAPKMEIVYNTYDAENYSARVNGVRQFLVSKEDVDAICQQIHLK